MKEAALVIEGMSCQHCVMRAKKAIDGVGGVSASEVQVGKAAVKYDEAVTDQAAIEAAVEKAGYKIVR